MANNPLLQKMAELRRSYFREGVLNSQFIQLEELEDETQQNFLAELMDEYFEDASNLMNILEAELRKENPGFSVIDRTLHQFKGSSLSVGAPKVTAAVIQMQECMKRGNLLICEIAFQRLKEKEGSFQRKLTEYLNIRKQTRPEEITEHYECDNDSE